MNAPATPVALAALAARLRRAAMALIVLAGGFGAAGALAEEDGALPTIEAFAESFERRSGFVDLLLDRDLGRVYLELGATGTPLLLQTSLARGVGSNDLGLDRGRLIATRLVEFQRIGRRALLRASNPRWRAQSAAEAEVRAAREAFATSVLAGLEVVAGDETRYLVDYTPFLVSDSLGLTARLAEDGEGRYAVDADRSAPWFPRTRAFPLNSELEAVLTLTGTPEGPWLRTVTPDAAALTVHVHHSLVSLPDDPLPARRHHPRSGYFVHGYTDYAAPLGAPLRQRLLPRHRLEPVDPTASPLVPKEPIVYYLDPGTPEPVRSALLDGAAWWNDAFAAAGWQDAFRVELLPDGADPMDVRYNVIQWVHRSTRGWSYGMSVRDPRSGEILKGHVTLGSLRVRQDMRIARSLATHLAPEAREAAIERFALARLRQLAAHEVGHTLGLAHNFAASTDGRASVMDYPHPRLGPPSAPIVDDAYDTGIGAWDRYTIRYGYEHFVSSEDEALADLRAAHAALPYATDADARPPDAAHPTAHLWDDGADVLAEFEHLRAVRRAALERFGPDALPQGVARSELERLLVPLYYLQRYQIEAVARLVGGVDYDFATEGAARVAIVPAAAQRAAIDALLGSLDLGELALPEALALQIPPAAPGHPRDRESPPGRLGLVFDPVTPAEALAEHVLRFLLAPGRLNRLAQQHALDPDVPSVTELLERLAGDHVRRAGDSAIEQRVALLVTEHLAMLAWNDVAAPEVTHLARAAVLSLEDDVGGSRRGSDARRGLRARIAALLARARDDGHFERREDVPNLPPGSPI